MGKKKFKHLIVIGHPNQKSFCYNGIFRTIVRQMRKHKENYKVIDLYEDKELGLLEFSLIKGDFRKFEGSWKIQTIKGTSKNSLIYDLTVQGCQWMPIGMIEKRLKKDLSENLIAVDKQAKISNLK